MLRFDFNTYVDKFIEKDDYNELLNQKEEIISKFNSASMIGWTKDFEKSEIEDLKETGKYIKESFDCLVVIGIGGSFLGSYAFDKMFRNYFNDSKYEIIYAGTTLSAKYLDELLEYLKNKNFCINVISKSGSTMETNITYKVLKDLLKEKFNDNFKDHIIVTTDSSKGPLREEVKKEGYKSFIIPDDIGGRYSFLTPAHLLPLSINYDLDEIVKGYYEGKDLIDKAYEYAVIRNLLFKSGKYIENYVVYEENMTYFLEWLKQLFGESEGKEGLGIYPTSTLHTRDLHSLGQFIQEGNKILFETFIKVDNSPHKISYENRELHEINNIVLESVIKAHYSGDVPCLEISIDSLSIENISSLIYFFMLSAAFSSLLFGVDPFNQPGVEVYKSEVRESLK